MKLLSIIKDVFGPSQEWEWHDLGYQQKVRAFDGTVLTRSVMRRKIKGQVQYRAPTEEEQKEAAEWQAHGF